MLFLKGVKSEGKEIKVFDLYGWIFSTRGAILTPHGLSKTFSTRGAFFLHVDAPASSRGREAPTLFHTTVIQMLSSFC